MAHFQNTRLACKRWRAEGETAIATQTKQQEIVAMPAKPLCGLCKERHRHFETCPRLFYIHFRGLVMSGYFDTREPCIHFGEKDHAPSKCPDHDASTEIMSKIVPKIEQESEYQVATPPPEGYLTEGSFHSEFSVNRPNTPKRSQNKPQKGPSTCSRCGIRPTYFLGQCRECFLQDPLEIFVDAPESSVGSC